MQAFPEYRNKPLSFWSLEKFVTEQIGYSRGGQVLSYSSDEIKRVCDKNNITVSDDVIIDIANYSKKRAYILNEVVEQLLMTVEEAEIEYNKLEAIHRAGVYYCKLPLNKQAGALRKINFYTGMINIITERTLRDLTGDTERHFDDDPRKLSYVISDDGHVIGSFSRRFDGAFPQTINPIALWEIKEYYYATTFGSRVADAIYETQLDGYEFSKLHKETNIKIYHFLFVDSYRTWWVQGKSYLCRIVDALNEGTVDEVIFGRELFSRWPVIIKELANAIGL